MAFKLSVAVCTIHSIISENEILLIFTGFRETSAITNVLVKVVDQWIQAIVRTRILRSPALETLFREIFSFVPNQRNEHKNRGWRNGSVECEYDKGCRGRPVPHTTYTVRLKLQSDCRAKGERALSLSLGPPPRSYTVLLRLLFFLLSATPPLRPQLPPILFLFLLQSPSFLLVPLPSLTMVDVG